VRQLEDRYAAGLGDRSALERTIIATSLRFGVLCRFTAYTAIDRAAVMNEGGEVHRITQPVEMPAGWSEDAERFVTCSMALEHPKLVAEHQRFATWTRSEASPIRARAFALGEVCPSPITEPNLTEWISRNGLPDTRAAARLVLVLAETLEYAGRQLVIHGNITADNIYIAADGTPRIAGFSLPQVGCRPAEPTARDRVYVAPELLQAGPAEPSASTDVYSLGVVFYRLLTGVLPDSDQGARGLRPPRAINPQVPVNLEAICLKAMADVPADRYATSGELAADLRRALGIKQPGLLGRITGRSKRKGGGSSAESEQGREFWKL
jgi:hypothetical protein